MTASHPQAPRPSGYDSNSGYRIAFEPCAKRVRVLFNGATIADSLAVRLLHEEKHLPVYYFPKADLRMEHLSPTAHATRCPYKGDATYWTVAVGERRAENAVWSYPAPHEQVAGIKDFMAFAWKQMDHWYEEDDEVLVHARDPYVRIDVLESHRPVTVALDGEVLAETSRARFLFETGLPVRYYIPAEDVRMELLEPSDSHSACPYKGTASYHSARIGGKTHDDIAWFYPEPLDECRRIRDYLCFYNERVEITVGGERQAQPKTKWSKDA